MQSDHNQHGSVNMNRNYIYDIVSSYLSHLFQNNSLPKKIIQGKTFKRKQYWNKNKKHAIDLSLQQKQNITVKSCFRKIPQLSCFRKIPQLSCFRKIP